MKRQKTYSAPTEELRTARSRSPLNAIQLAKRIKVKTWELAGALTDGYVSLAVTNKVRTFFKLAPVWELPRKTVVKPEAKAPREAAVPPPPEIEALPMCDWEQIAAAAAELSTASADFHFAAELLRDAELRLRAAQRRALAAGVAIAPALTSGGDKTLKASKHTTQFFKLLSVGGALKL